MSFILSSEAVACGYRVESHESVGSTNFLAHERAKAGDSGQLWICALEQSAGRGRRGRDWSNPYGNLAATLLLCEPFPPAIAATLGFVAGISMIEALEAVLSPSLMQAGAVQLKWPNDILAEGKKLCGILLEQSVVADGKQALAVGIGVNVVAFPPDMPYPVTSLAALGSSASAQELFFALSQSWARNYILWNEGRGMGAIRDLWLSHAAGLGAPVTISLGGRMFQGTFTTIDKEGRLILRGDDGHDIEIAAGDVHFGAAASVRG